MKIGMLEMLYDKSLRISSSVRSDMGIGSIVNLQSNDAAKIWNIVLYLHILWNGPFQVPRTHARGACTLSLKPYSPHTRGTCTLSVKPCPPPHTRDLYPEPQTLPPHTHTWGLYPEPQTLSPHTHVGPVP